MIYKLIYKDSHGLDRIKEISQEQYEDYAEKKKKRFPILVEGVGIIDHKDIRLVEEKEQSQEEIMREEEMRSPTCYDIHPPSKEDWDALCLAVLTKYPWLVPQEEKIHAKTYGGFVHISTILPTILPKIGLSMAKSAWNWNNQKTEDFLQLGRKLRAEGKTFQGIYKSISKTQLRDKLKPTQ